MNYLKHYCNLIRKAENRILIEGYTEKHHTFPKSIFGKNNRIVVLTAREHYVAHALLERICIKRYGLYNWKTIKMIKAFWSMNNRSKKYNSTLYESSKENKSFSMKLQNPGKEEHSRNLSRVRFLKNNPSKNIENAKKISNRMKLSNPMKNEEIANKLLKYEYKIITPNGQVIVLNNLSKFCKENNLDHSAMWRVAKNKLNHYKKYKVEIL